MLVRDGLLRLAEHAQVVGVRVFKHIIVGVVGFFDFVDEEVLSLNVGHGGLEETACPSASEKNGE